MDLPSCKGPLESVGLSEIERRDIIDLHNRLRKNVMNGLIDGLPPAEHMKALSWDKKLELECIRWIRLCPDGFEHSHPPDEWQKMPYGQNMGWGHASILDTAEAWFEEYKPYVEAGVNPLVYRERTDDERMRYKLGMIGHFTAMINANSSKIGCSKASADTSVVEFGIVYCCNYSPPGNIVKVSREGALTSIPAYKALSPEIEYYRGNKKVSSVPAFSHHTKLTTLETTTIPDFFSTIAPYTEEEEEYSSKSYEDILYTHKSTDILTKPFPKTTATSSYEDLNDRFYTPPDQDFHYTTEEKSTVEKIPETTTSEPEKEIVFVVKPIPMDTIEVEDFDELRHKLKDVILEVKAEENGKKWTDRIRDGSSLKSFPSVKIVDLYE